MTHITTSFIPFLLTSFGSFVLYSFFLFLQIFYSFFKTLVGQRVRVELKNDMEIEGRLESVDQFLNVKLSDISVVDEEKYPHLVHERIGAGLLRFLTSFIFFSWP